MKNPELIQYIASLPVDDQQIILQSILSNVAKLQANCEHLNIESDRYGFAHCLDCAHLDTGAVESLADIEEALA